MRNEIYAHHGYTFTSADLKAHFAKMSWYKPLGDNSKSFSANWNSSKWI